MRFLCLALCLASSLQAARQPCLEAGIRELMKPPRTAKADAVHILAQANRSYKLRRYKTAALNYELLTHKYPKLVQGWYGLGACQYVRGNYEAAGQFLKEALRRDPKDSLSSCLLVLAQDQLQRSKERALAP